MQKCYIIFLFLLLSRFGSAQTTVAIVAGKDNTIYSAFPTNSNGAGEYFFVGKNAAGNAGSVQRALLQFDVSTIPANAVITSAALTLYVNKSAPEATGIELLKVSAAWGEGTSDASGREAQGAAATANDATWQQKTFPSPNWTTAGGDFSSAVSATVPLIAAGIGAATAVTLTGPAMVGDVQGWLANSANNFGWIIKANDETLGASVKRFTSRNSTLTAQRPTLSVIYEVSLPVTLKGFSATISKQDVLLRWVTATELNNDHFEIEHSINGREFTLIGKVDSRVLASTGQSYAYYHTNPRAGKHFYRIIDVDKSGGKTYSPVISVSVGGTATLQLYPNPAISSVSVSASSLLTGAAFTVTSMNGQAVLRGVLQDQHINIINLNPGQYWLLVKTKDGQLLKSQFLKK
jgi:hypothetical protein